MPKVVAKEDRFNARTGEQLLFKGRQYIAFDSGSVQVVGKDRQHVYSASLFEPYVPPRLFKEGDVVRWLKDDYNVGRYFNVKRDQQPGEDYIIIDPPLSGTVRSSKVSNFALQYPWDARKLAVSQQDESSKKLPNWPTEWLPNSDISWSKFIAAGGKLHFRSGCEAKFVAFVKDAKPHCQLVLINPATGNIVTRYANGKGSTETYPEPGDILIGAGTVVCPI